VQASPMTRKELVEGLVGIWMRSIYDA
jgi:hypothetical protein